MNILAMQSSGDQTSVSVMLDEEINSFSLTHARKDRPDWDMFLFNVGFKRDFELKDIDLFAFGPSLIQKVKGDYFLIAESLLFNLFVSKFRGT